MQNNPYFMKQRLGSLNVCKHTGRYCPKMAEKENPTINDTKSYFYSIKKFLKLKKNGGCIKVQDDVSIYKDNPDALTKIFTFVEGEYEINKKIAESKADADK